MLHHWLAATIAVEGLFPNKMPFPSQPNNQVCNNLKLGLRRNPQRTIHTCDIYSQNRFSNRQPLDNNSLNPSIDEQNWVRV